MSTLAEVPPVKSRREVLDQAVIRFAGDSGDGMQITGNQFTNTAALYGNDIATFPDYPAEIRAPAGTIPGVSGFQLHFSSNEVYTPGDAIDELISLGEIGHVRRILERLSEIESGSPEYAAFVGRMRTIVDSFDLKRYTAALVGIRDGQIREGHA